MKLYVLLCFVAFATSRVIEDEARIIGGENAQAGQLPWQVLVRYRVPGGLSFCGGTLVSDRWVITAAHCTRDATDFSVKLGAIERSGSQSGTVEIAARQVIVHEDYDGFLKNDVALIETVSAVQFTDRIRPAKLPKKGNVVGVDVKLTVSGWGKTEEVGPVSEDLKFVALRSISNKECVQDYGSEYVLDSTLCAKGYPYNSTCNGDSGGPVVLLNGADTTHVGIVSFGSSAGCAQGKSSGFVRVESYIDWIHDKTGIPRF